MTRRISAANRKVAQGHVGKALQALLQPGILEVTVETLEQLQQLHTLSSLQPTKVTNSITLLFSLMPHSA